MSRALMAMALIGTVSLGTLIGVSVPQGVTVEAPASKGARFTICHVGGGTNCVVDGDTAWIDGEKVRIADIDAPETHPPRCQSESELGDRATSRLAELMNAGPFEQRPAGRDVDRYGRRLRVLVRDGRSLGDQLVTEGLARTWEGRRRPWC
jgi:endonuclease YncB( thermonuclease family)